MKGGKKMKVKVTTIYKVYSCDDGGRPIENSLFTDFDDARSYAIANKCRIHYGLPVVESHIYTYNPNNQTVSKKVHTIPPERVYGLVFD